MEEKCDIIFRSTKSPIGIISGLALGKDGGVLASFKLETGKDHSFIRGSPYRPVILTMVCPRKGAKVYDVFDKILSQYSEEDLKSQTGNVDRIRCCWKVPEDDVDRVFKDVKDKLEVLS